MSLAREPFGLQLENRPPLLGQAAHEAGRRPRGLGHFAGRVDLRGDLLGTPTVGPERLLTMHVLLPARGTAILVDHFILRSPGQKGDKMTGILELGRPARTRRKKLPQTLWRKSSESNRDRKSRGNCRRTTSRTSGS